MEKLYMILNHKIMLVIIIAIILTITGCSTAPSNSKINVQKISINDLPPDIKYYYIPITLQQHDNMNIEIAQDDQNNSYYKYNNYTVKVINNVPVNEKNIPILHIEPYSHYIIPTIVAGYKSNNLNLWYKNGVIPNPLIGESISKFHIGQQHQNICNKLKINNDTFLIIYNRHIELIKYTLSVLNNNIYDKHISVICIINNNYMSKELLDLNHSYSKYLNIQMLFWPTNEIKDLMSLFHIQTTPYILYIQKSNKQEPDYIIKNGYCISNYNAIINKILFMLKQLYYSSHISMYNYIKNIKLQNIYQSSDNITLYKLQQQKRIIIVIDISSLNQFTILKIKKYHLPIVLSNIHNIPLPYELFKKYNLNDNIYTTKEFKDSLIMSAFYLNNSKYTMSIVTPYYYFNIYFLDNDYQNNYYTQVLHCLLKFSEK